VYDINLVTTTPSSTRSPPGRMERCDPGKCPLAATPPTTLLLWERTEAKRALEEHGPPANSKPAVVAAAAAAGGKARAYAPNDVLNPQHPSHGGGGGDGGGGKAWAYAPNDVRSPRHPNHNKMKTGTPRASRCGRPPRHIRRIIPAPVTPAISSASVPPTTLKLLATVLYHRPLSRMENRVVGKQ
jgi:hypothetical protein